jgi:hypothetical protein
MSDSPRSEAQVAFIAAAVVLLALPLLVVFGLVAIALVMQAASRSDQLALVVLFAVWVAVAVIASIVSPSGSFAAPPKRPCDWHDVSPLTSHRSVIALLWSTFPHGRHSSPPSKQRGRSPRGGN